MAGIDHLFLEAVDVATAEHLFGSALGLGDLVRVGASEEPSSGFRGFTLSFIAAQPADVDKLFADALGAGATTLQPAKKSLWGYGGVLEAPDGTICTFASSSKKDTGPVTGRIDEVVLQLGVADVASSKRFYVDRGFTVAKSHGRKYVELDTGRVTLTLYTRDALAKVAGVPAEGSGSHRLTIGSDAGPFVDPDGFVWQAHS